MCSIDFTYTTFCSQPILITFQSVARHERFGGVFNNTRIYRMTRGGTEIWNELSIESSSVPHWSPKQRAT